MNKHHFLGYLFSALLGGVLSVYLTFSFSEKISTAIIGYQIQQEEKLRDNGLTSISTVNIPGFWEKIVEESVLSSVGIQIFKNNQLVRQGSGIIISSDGLIVTVNDLFIADSFYQIFYEEKIVKGVIVSRNYDLNLMLLKTSASYSSLADFDLSYSYKSGQEILATGKAVSISKSYVISEKGIISSVNNGIIVLDIFPENHLIGASVNNADGKFIGLAYLRNNRMRLIKAETIESFFKTYIESLKNVKREI